MNKEIKDKWLRDMRSGEYKQCFGHYYKDGCYCALGLLLKDFFDIKTYYSQKTYFHSIPEFLNRVFDWPNSRDIRLMNDNEHATFNEIADYVEKNL